MPTLLVRRKNTVPELAVQKVVRELGLWFQTSRTDLPGSPDLVFPASKTECLYMGVGSTNTNAERPRKPTLTFGGRNSRGIKHGTLRTSPTSRSSDWNVIVVFECGTNDEKRVAVELLACV